MSDVGRRNSKIGWSFVNLFRVTGKMNEGIGEKAFVNVRILVRNLSLSCEDG